MHYDSLGGGIEYVYKYIKVSKLIFVLIIYIVMQGENDPRVIPIEIF